MFHMYASKKGVLLDTPSLAGSSVPFVLPTPPVLGAMARGGRRLPQPRAVRPGTHLPCAWANRTATGAPRCIGQTCPTPPRFPQGDEVRERGGVSGERAESRGRARDSRHRAGASPREGPTAPQGEGEARGQRPDTPCAQGREREQRRRAKAEPRQPDTTFPRAEPGGRGRRALVGRSACCPRADRGPGVALPEARGDGRGEPGVLRLLQPQPQLRGALPVPPARRGGRPPLLLRLRGPQVLLRRAGQLLPLQAQLHVEPQVGRAGGWRAGAGRPPREAGRRPRPHDPPPTPGGPHPRRTGSPQTGEGSAEKPPAGSEMPRGGRGSRDSSGEGRTLAAKGVNPLWDPRRGARGRSAGSAPGAHPAARRAPRRSELLSPLPGDQSPGGRLLWLAESRQADNLRRFSCLFGAFK